MSPRFLADENIDPDLVLGLKRRIGGIDIVRVQDVGLRTLDDPTILQWAADEGRVLISRDIKTIPTFAHDRVTAGLGHAGSVSPASDRVDGGSDRRPVRDRRSDGG